MSFWKLYIGPFLILFIFGHNLNIINGTWNILRDTCHKPIGITALFLTTVASFKMHAQVQNIILGSHWFFADFFTFENLDFDRWNFFCIIAIILNLKVITISFN